MSAPKIVYNTGTGGDVTLVFLRGPVDFLPEWAPVVHDNVASSGAARERVMENGAIMIPFGMPALMAAGDLAAWMTFMGWAIGGGVFKFYPNAALADYYNCVEESGAWQPKRVGPGVYTAAFRFRVLMDGQAPADPGTILRRFMGITG